MADNCDGYETAVNLRGAITYESLGLSLMLHLRDVLRFDMMLNYHPLVSRSLALLFIMS